MPLVRYVGGTWRVGGILALSRAFGDAYLKGSGQFEGVPSGSDGYGSGFGVVADPTVSLTPLTRELPDLHSLNPYPRGGPTTPWGPIPPGASPSCLRPLHDALLNTLPSFEMSSFYSLSTPVFDNLCIQDAALLMILWRRQL